MSPVLNPSQEQELDSFVNGLSNHLFNTNHYNSMNPFVMYNQNNNSIPIDEYLNSSDGVDCVGMSGKVINDPASAAGWPDQTHEF